MKKKLFMIDTVSTFKMRYMIEAKNLEDAMDELTLRNTGGNIDFDEFSQRHIGEEIFETKEITKDDFKKLLNSDENASYWMGEDLIHKVKYGRKTGGEEESSN